MSSADVKREAKPSSWRVALWQPAVPTREKFEPEQQRQLPARFQSALVAAQQAGAAWLVAPEGALPLQARLLEPAPIPLLTGGFRWLRGQQRSALLLVEAGDRLPSQALDKHRLVPLGEWIPPWLSALPGCRLWEGLSPVKHRACGNGPPLPGLNYQQPHKRLPHRLMRMLSLRFRPLQPSRSVTSSVMGRHWQRLFTLGRSG